MTPRLRRYYDDILAEEEGTLFKDPGGKITICLVFPNQYRAAISNLGYQYVYALLNAHRDVLCERAFLPEGKVLEEHRRTSTPIVSLESRKPLSHFDIVAFSLSYENDYPNVLTILDLGGIPLLSHQRGPYDPLVVAGGAAVSLNPEPMAPLFDCILVGEAEALLDGFLEALRENWGRDRGELLRTLAQVRGIYVPSLYEPVYNPDGTLKGIYPRREDLPERIEHRRSKDLPLLCAPLTSRLGEFGDSVLVEVARGCPFSCKFCVVKPLYDPFRPCSFERVREAIKEGVRRTGKVGLLGAALGSHPHFEQICWAVLEEGGRFSLSSLRADRLTSRVAEALSASGQRSITLAPETGSEDLRFRIGKRIPDEVFLRAVEVLTEKGILNLRLYFMVGLPGATEGEGKAIVKLVKALEARQRAVSGGRKGNITVTLSPFIPKPWTPFQWYPFAGLKKVRVQIEEIKRSLKGVKVHYDLPKWAYWESCFSLGDRRLGLALWRGYKEGNWIEVLKKGFINPDFWALREKGKREFLPWEILEFPFGREDLWERKEED